MTKCDERLHAPGNESVDGSLQGYDAVHRLTQEHQSDERHEGQSMQISVDEVQSMEGKDEAGMPKSSTTMTEPGECDEREMEKFTPVLKRLRLDRIPKFASSLRKLDDEGKPFDTSGTITLDNPPYNCQILTPPLSGSFHIVYRLVFNDGVKWMLKIPAAGYGKFWNNSILREQYLRSEALTMRLIKQNTTIPVPAIIAYDPSTTNELGCPYILMEHLEGTPLYRSWFRNEISEKELFDFRSRCLESLAFAMMQLNRFVYRSSGSLVFNQDGAPCCQAATKTVIPSDSVHSQWWRPWRGNIDIGDVGGVDPYQATRSFLLRKLHERDPPDRKHKIGSAKLLEYMVRWVPTQYIEQDFVLAHPDLDFQNVLVADDGTLQGLIDWDGVAAVPRMMGCEQPPKWLTHDWDPFFYNFDEKTGELADDNERPEHSPAELVHWRSVYANYMEKYISDNAPHNHRPTHDARRN